MAPTPINPILPVSLPPQADAAHAGSRACRPAAWSTHRSLSVLADNLVRIAIANLSIDVMSEVALTPGQNLQLAVSQNDGTIRLAVMVGQAQAARRSGHADAGGGLAGGQPTRLRRRSGHGAAIP